MKGNLFSIALILILACSCTNGKANAADKIDKSNIVKLDNDEYKKQNDLNLKIIKAIDANDLQAIDKLLKDGADINFKDAMGGFTVLIYSIQNKYFEAAKYLISKGADINNSTSSAISPLMFALSKGNFELAKIMIEKGAKVDVKDADGRTPLVYAIYSGSVDNVELLIRRKAEVNLKFMYKKNQDDMYEEGVEKTLIEAAKELGNQKIIDLLIAAGAK